MNIANQTSQSAKPSIGDMPRLMRHLETFTDKWAIFPVCLGLLFGVLFL